MLGIDRPPFGHDVPGPIGALLQIEDAVVFDHCGTALLRGACVSPDRARRIYIALAIGPHAAEYAVNADNGAERLDFVGRHQPNILDPDRLEPAIGRLQPFPTLRSRRDMDPARHVHADRLAGLRFDFLKEVDRIGLQDRHVRIGVERMEAARCMPGRTRGEHGSLDQGDVRPTEFRKMVKNGGPNDAASDDDDPVARIHLPPTKAGSNREATELARRRLDIPVQRAPFALLAVSVAFAALSPSVGYEYG